MDWLTVAARIHNASEELLEAWGYAHSMSPIAGIAMAPSGEIRVRRIEIYAPGRMKHSVFVMPGLSWWLVAQPALGIRVGARWRIIHIMLPSAYSLTTLLSQAQPPLQSWPFRAARTSSASGAAAPRFITAMPAAAFARRAASPKAAPAARASV